MADAETLELVTLPHAPADDLLAQLLQVGGGAEISARHGQDAAGRPRLVLQLRHTDPEVVAQTRQNLLRACQRARVAAFVV